MSMASAIFIRFSTTSILSETFAPPRMATNGRSGFEIGFAEIGELFFHQQAGGGLLDEFGDADDGSVSAMGGAKSVANEETVTKRG